MGASAKQTGLSQAEPEVSALRASIPCAWQPIETYDKLTQKPALAAFAFAAVKPSRPGGIGLRPTVELSRRFGNRICTHWMPLPAPPAID